MGYQLRSLLAASVFGSASLLGLTASAQPAATKPPAPEQGASMSPASGPGAAAAMRQQRPLIFAWAPKKDPYQAYDPPNRPLWRLADVLAMHKGQKTWSQPIARNKDLWGDWHQMGQGESTHTVMYPDNRVGMIVWDGQLKVSIQGQEPFIATKGFEIDVPFRVPFTLEAVGDKPALWFEVHQADDLPIYPVETTPEKPANVPGFSYHKVIISGGPGTWDDKNKPYLDYYKDVVQGGQRAGAFIASDHMFINNIRGKGAPVPPPTDLGHYHVDFTEFWFIMEGQIDYQIEGVPFIEAHPGDIVTAAQGRWHRASSGGPIGQMDTRVAINPFPRGLHDFPEDSGGRQ
jgi:mannose-6-phosphate isomerase-like protein (cupin superfamily)